jgi:hypothetical protein
MPLHTEQTGDITPPLSKEEAIAIMRGGLGEAELKLVASFCAPIYWVKARLSHGTLVTDNGTAYFLDAGNGVFGVTACHVVHGWMRDRQKGAGPLCLATKGGPIELDWSARVIASHSAIDIATFRISAEEVAALGVTVLTGSQKTWPPKPPQKNRGIYYCGYPKIETMQIGRDALSLGCVRGSGVASSVNDRDIVTLFDRSCWLPDPVHGAPAENYNFAGISGGLMLTVVEGTLRSWALSGTIWEGPSTSKVPGEAIEGFEVVRARRAHFIKPTGELDTALWYSVGGAAHVEPR